MRQLHEATARGNCTSSQQLRESPATARVLSNRTSSQQLRELSTTARVLSNCTSSQQLHEFSATARVLSNCTSSQNCSISQQLQQLLNYNSCCRCSAFVANQRHQQHKTDITSIAAEHVVSARTTAESSTKTWILHAALKAYHAENRVTSSVTPEEWTPAATTYAPSTWDEATTAESPKSACLVAEVSTEDDLLPSLHSALLASTSTKRRQSGTPCMVDKLGRLTASTLT
jgi:hypothetical protein